MLLQIKSNIITESDAIKILANPNEFEGIYTFENSYAKELAQKASKMKEPIAHTDANMLFNNRQQAHYHAVLQDGTEGHAHAWFGNIRGEGNVSKKKKKKK